MGYLLELINDLPGASEYREKIKQVLTEKEVVDDIEKSESYSLSQQLEIILKYLKGDVPPSLKTLLKEVIAFQQQTEGSALIDILQLHAASQLSAKLSLAYFNCMQPDNIEEIAFYDKVMMVKSVDDLCLWINKRSAEANKTNQEGARHAPLECSIE